MRHRVFPGIFPIAVLMALASAPITAGSTASSLRPVPASVRALPASPAAADEGLPYEDLAANFRQRYGIAAEKGTEMDFEAFLEQHFIRAQVGIFTLHMSVQEIERKDPADSYRKMALALLEAQEAWLDWVEPAAGDLTELRKDHKTLNSWVKTWRNGVLIKEATEGGQDLLDAMNAKAKVREASERFAEAMGRHAVFGVKRADAIFEPIVLIAHRREFVEFLCFAGWAWPADKNVFWRPEIANWTESYIGRTKLIALEYAAGGRAADDFSSGTSMNEVAPNGMEQQIVQLAMNAFFDNCFGDNVPPAFAGGLALNAVIDVYGEARTRVDGDLRERRTNAIEIFVPGGQSQGGVLPGISADSRWRDENGTDRFTRVLRASQKNGAAMSKKAKDKVSHFRLLEDEMVETLAIHGPYLGSPALDFKVPDEPYQGDYVEFLRSYRCGFVHWLRTKTERKSKDSAKLFAELLKGMALAESPQAFEKVFEEVYEGTPLSSEQLGGSSLEGRFLTWLAKQ